MIDIDTTSFFAVVVAAAIASLVVAQPDDFIGFFADLGLGMLFFFAGFEIDFERIRRPLRLASLGWALSLVLVFPLVGLRLRKGRAATDVEPGLDGAAVAPA